MSFNQVLADRILEFAALEPTIPAGTANDFYDPEFEEDDFEDTAAIISSTSVTLGVNVMVAFGFLLADISNLKSVTPRPNSQSLIFIEYPEELRSCPSLGSRLGLILSFNSFMFAPSTCSTIS